jgi:RecA-family ATPase
MGSRIDTLRQWVANAEANGRFNTDFHRMLKEAEQAAPKSAAAPASADLPCVRANDLAVRMPKQREWIVESLIPKGETTLLYGPGAAGKSLLLLQLALGIAAGRRWLGLPVPRGRVLFFTCEDDADEINRRGLTILREMDLSWFQVGERFLAVPMRGTDQSAVLAVAQRDGTLAPSATYAALRAMVERYKPDVVILDTLADIFAGNENDRSHAKQFVKLIERLYPATFLVTAHPSVSGQADGRGASGSTGWPAAVRSHLYLERARPEDGTPADPDLRQLSNLKSNYARAGDGGIELRWKDGVFVRSDRQAREADGTDKADDVFVELLRTFNARRVNVSTSPGTTYAPSVFAKEDAAKAQRISKKMLVAAMGRLIDAGRIRNVQHRGGSDPRFHLEVCPPPLEPPTTTDP